MDSLGATTFVLQNYFVYIHDNNIAALRYVQIEFYLSVIHHHQHERAMENPMQVGGGVEGVGKQKVRQTRPTSLVLQKKLYLRRSYNLIII